MNRSQVICVGFLLLAAGIGLFGSDMEPAWEPAPACDPWSSSYSATNNEQGFRACFLESGLRLIPTGKGSHPLELLLSAVCKNCPEGLEPFFSPVAVNGGIEYLHPESGLTISMRSDGLLLDYSGISGLRFALNRRWWPQPDEVPAVLHILPEKGTGFDLRIEPALDAAGASLDVKWEIHPVEGGGWVIGLSDPPDDALLPIAVKILLKADAFFPKEIQASVKKEAKKSGAKTGGGPDELGQGMLAAPQIFAISPDHGPTAGGGTITLSGSFTGGSGTLYFNGGSISYTGWTDTMITFSSPPGQGLSIPVFVSNGSGTSNTVPFNYDPPSISSLYPNHGPTPGGTLVTLNGINFGTGGTVTLGGTICPPQTWGHAQITFLTPPGQGTNLPVVVNTGGQASNSVQFSYDPPSISVIDPNHGPTAGGTLVTLDGMNFGTSGTLMFNGAICVPQSWSHTQITFLTPPGQGTNLPAEVTVGGQTSNSLPFSYDPPVISLIDPNHGPTAGGTLVTLDGLNFGTNGTVMFNGAICPHQSWSHTQVKFFTPQGQGTNLPVEVTVGGQTSNSLPFSYDPPVISLIDPNHGPTAGGTLVTLDGLNFGTNGTVMFNGAICVPQSWSHSQVTFLSPPGQGTNLPVEVTVGGQTSNTVTFSYDPPVIFGLAPNHGPTVGGTPVTLSGMNFGIGGTVTVAGIPGVPQVWTHTAITFLTPEGQGINLPIVVMVGGLVSNPALFSYDPPVIFGLAPNHGPAAGGTLVTLNGLNFGTVGTVTVNGALGTPQDWSHTWINFLTPPGQGIGVPVQVTVGGQPSTSFPFTYDRPRETAPATSGTDVLLWTADDALAWPVNPDALGGYRLYRGTGPDLPALLTGDPDSCLRGLQASQNDPTFANLAEIPGETQGYLFWYLVTGVNASGEGISGYATSGLRQLDSRGACE